MAGQPRWYAYPLSFVGGALAMNSLPHLVHGVSGQDFPSAFADPPGRADSPPLANVAWAGINLALASVALGAARASKNPGTAIAAAGGASAMAVLLARFFGDR